jgi:hypothetical protein
MYATWPMVFAALAAGAVGGFMIPDRPQSRPEAVAKASDIPQVIPALRASVQKPVEVTETKAPPAPPPLAAKEVAVTESCGTQSWPYRTPGCLDRTAALEPAPVVVNARRVDPAISLRDMNPDKQPTAVESPPAPKQKVVSAPARQNEDMDRPRANGRRVNANAAEGEMAPARDRRLKRRPADRPNFRLVEGEWREEQRVYFRDRDGRLYLAPEYRPAPRASYYIR